MSDRDQEGIGHLKDRLYSRATAPDVDTSKRTPLSPLSDRLQGAFDGVRRKTRGRFIGGVPEGQENIPGGEQAHEALGKEGGGPAALSDSPFDIAMNKPPRTRRSGASWFLWGSVSFFVLAAAAASVAFFGGGNTISSSNISLDIVAPPLVDSGKPATIEYVVDNRNNTKLIAADIVVAYPVGTRASSGAPQELQRDRISLGDINAGQQVLQTSSVAFYGEEGTSETIQATLEYQIAGSNAIFIKEAQTSFTIGSSPVSVSVSAPKEAISGQGFDVDLTVQSNATAPLSNLALEVQYPFGFVPTAVSPQAEAGDTFWRLPTIDPGQEQHIHISGTLAGEDGDARVLHFLIGSQADQTATRVTTPILSVPQTITVRKPFVSARIALDGQTGSTIAETIGRSYNGEVTWQNNLPDSVSNLALTLSFSGAAIDPASIEAGSGFYDSSRSAIVWSSTQDPSLASVAPGASGSYQFSFSTLPPATRVFTNPTLSLSLTAAATRQGQDNVPSNVSSAAALTVNLASNVSLSAQSLYATGPFTNVGPMPPRANQQTTYTVLWTAKSSSNTIADARVQATLPPYVEFVQAQGGLDQVSFDAASRTVSWSLGDLRAGAGWGTPARQAAFQVRITPSTSQVAQSPKLTSDALFSGQDRFAQTGVSASAPAPTTATGEAGVSGTVQ